MQALRVDRGHDLANGLLPGLLVFVGHHGSHLFVDLNNLVVHLHIGHSRHLHAGGHECLRLLHAIPQAQHLARIHLGQRGLSGHGITQPGQHTGQHGIQTAHTHSGRAWPTHGSHEQGGLLSFVGGDLGEVAPGQRGLGKLGACLGLGFCHSHEVRFHGLRQRVKQAIQRCIAKSVGLLLRQRGQHLLGGGRVRIAHRGSLARAHLGKACLRLLKGGDHHLQIGAHLGRGLLEPLLQLVPQRGEHIADPREQTAVWVHGLGDRVLEGLVLGEHPQILLGH